MEVLHCDNHLLVVDKPAGLSVQPYLLDAAKAWIKEHTGKERPFLEVIHRLDRPVSGVVIFARTSKALSRLNEMQRGRSMRKRYLALVEGRVRAHEGVLEHSLLHARGHARIARGDDRRAKRARLKFRCLKRESKTSLLEIELETGRYHQIRVQLAAIGHPIVGDALYGSRIHWHSGAIALQHAEVQCAHPVTKEMHSFQSVCMGVCGIQKLTKNPHATSASDKLLMAVKCDCAEKKIVP